MLDLNHIGTKIGKNMTKHIACHQSGQVKDTNIGKRPLSFGIKGSSG
jgi:hypothetical protein